MSNSSIEYFTDKNKLLFYAIDIEKGFFVYVELMKSETIIQFNTGKNLSELTYTRCLESEHRLPCTELEFAEAIGKADCILHETPFL